MSNANLKLIITARDDASKDLKKIAGNLEDVGNSAEKAQAKTESFANRALKGAIVGASVAAVAALGKVGVSAIAVAADYESTLNRFASVAGSAIADAGMSIGQFNDLALEMGAKTQFSAGQAADAMVELAKGGLQPATIAAGGLKGALDLAAAGELDLSEAAGITAKQLGVWGDQGVTAADVADKLAQAANASTVDVADLALGLANAGGSAKVAGLDFDELNQTMALLAPGFSSAGDAGTSLKTFLSSMAPDTAKSIDAFRELNLLTDEGKSKFFDLNGAFVGMEEVTRLLADGTRDLSGEQKTMALSAAFGSDAIRAAALLADQGAEGYRAMGTAMDGAGTAAEQAAERNKGLNFAIESLKGSLETIGIVVGSAVVPALTDFVQDALIPAANNVLSFAQAVTSADDPMGELVKRIDDALPGFRGAVTVIGATGDIISDNLVPAMYALSTGTTVYAIGSLPKMITALGVATKALYAQGAAATAALGPLGIVAGIAALAVGGLVKVHQDGEQRIEDMTQAVQDEIAVLQDAQKALDALQASQAGSTKGAEANIAELERLKQAHTEVTAKIEEAKFSYLDMADAFAREKALAPFIEQQHQLEDQISAVSDRMRMQAQSQAYLDAGLKGSTGTWSAYSGGVQDVSKALKAVAENTQVVIPLKPEEIDKLTEALGKLRTDGASALGDLVNTTISFQQDLESTSTEHWATLAGLHKEWADATTADERDAIQQRIDAEVTGFATSQSNAANAYATEQAANRSHLGSLLIDTVNAWQTLGTVPGDMADTLRTGIAEHFGVASDAMSLQFGNMLGVLRGVADGTGVAADDMGAAFGAIEQAAVTSATNTASTQKQMVANLTAQYTAGKISFEEYQAALAKVPAVVNTLVTSNVPEQVAYWQTLGEKQGAISPVTNTTITSNVPAEITYWQNLGKEQQGIAPITPANVADNVDEVRGRYLILSAKRAAMALDKPAVNVTTNADAVTEQIKNVTTAVNNIPPSKTVTIRAVIDPALQRHSPSPIEQVMMAIDDFASRRHVLQVDMGGSAIREDLAGLREALAPSASLTGGYAAAPTPMSGGEIGPFRRLADDWKAGLQDIITGLTGANRDIQRPADDIQSRLDRLADGAENLAERLRMPTLDIQGRLDGLASGVSNVADRLQMPISDIQSRLDGLAGGTESLADRLSVPTDAIRSRLQTAVDAIAGSADAIGLTAPTMWEPLTGTLSTVPGAIESQGGAIVAKMNAMVDAYNAAIARIKTPEFIGSYDRGDPYTPQPPGRTPFFASGVTNFAGGLAYVHAGELLTNLPRGTDVIKASDVRSTMPNNQLGRGGDTYDNRVIFEAGAIVQQPGQDTRQLAAAVADEIDRRNRIARTR